MLFRKRDRFYILAALLCLFSFFFVSQKASALSPSYTQPNYIWRTYANAERWVLQEQGQVSLKNYIFSNIGDQFIGRYQFAFPTSISNLSDNTVLTFEFALKHEEAPGVPGGGGTIRGWGNSREARINIGGSSSGYCSVRQDIWTTLTFTCEYVWDNTNVDLSTIWVDVGNFAVEANGIPWGNPNGDYLLYGHTFWVEYINYYYQTGLPASSQAIINAINNSNSVIINQNQQMIDNSQEYYDKTYDASDNISNQSSSDIQGTENQKTTDLIGALGSLVGAFTSIRPSDNCEIQLDFPSYAGGTQIVNPCQHKEKAPQIVLIGSSVFLVLFALKYWNAMSIKIYKVIRSFIDGTDDTEGEE